MPMLHEMFSQVIIAGSLAYNAWCVEGEGGGSSCHEPTVGVLSVQFGCRRSGALHVRTLVFACNGCQGEYGCIDCQNAALLGTAWIRERGRAAFGEPARRPLPLARVATCALPGVACACQRRTWRGARRVGSLQPAIRPSARGCAVSNAAASLSLRARALRPSPPSYRRPGN